MDIVEILEIVFGGTAIVCGIALCAMQIREELKGDWWNETL